MAGVVEQADCLAGMVHQRVDLVVGLDDGAHMMMKGHADAEIGHLLGECRDLDAIGRHSSSARRGRSEIGRRIPSCRPREVSA